MFNWEKALDISEKATYKYAQVFEFEFFVASFNLVTATSVLEANFLGRPPLYYVRMYEMATGTVNGLTILKVSVLLLQMMVVMICSHTSLQS